MIIEAYNNKLAYRTALALKNNGDIEIGLVHSRLDVIYKTPSFREIIAKTTIITAFRFYLYTAVCILILSIILSVSSFWWAFIPGWVIAGLIANANKRALYENILAETLINERLYDELVSMHALLYNFKDNNTATCVFENRRIINEIKDKLPPDKRDLIDALSEEKKEELIRKYRIKMGK